MQSVIILCLTVCVLVWCIANVCRGVNQGLSLAIIVISLALNLFNLFWAISSKTENTPDPKEALVPYMCEYQGGEMIDGECYKNGRVIDLKNDVKIPIAPNSQL